VSISPALRMSPDARKRRSVLANKAKSHGPNHPAVIEARRDLRFQMLMDHATRVLAADPPTPQQIDQLASLLAGAR
jgi:hypothetical protein